MTPYGEPIFTVCHRVDPPETLATEDYERDRLEDAEIRPMSNGFLEGGNAELL